MIETLPLLTPDPARAERLRARCHEQLNRARLRTSPPAPSWERALVGVCGIYLSVVVMFALQILSSR